MTLPINYVILITDKNVEFYIYYEYRLQKRKLKVYQITNKEVEIMQNAITLETVYTSNLKKEKNNNSLRNRIKNMKK